VQVLIWAKKLGLKTVCYVDYYTQLTIPLFKIYDALICNTKRHHNLFKKYGNSHFLPWGTDIGMFQNDELNKGKLIQKDSISFFHSCGHAPYRKGTDLLLMATSLLNEKNNFKLIVHTQLNLEAYYKDDQPVQNAIKQLLASGKLEIIEKSVPLPGLYHLGDVYVYPSRLDGIGLTIAEAKASGLATILPDVPPMNEFENKKYPYLISPEKLFCRYDGYYWPMNEISINCLKNKMEDMIGNPLLVKSLKEKSYNHAIEHLDWNINSSALLDLVQKIEFKQLTETSITEINKFERSGVNILNSLFVRFQTIYILLKRFYSN